MKPKHDALQLLMHEVGRILDETDIRPTDNFVELGGNSFLALQVAIHLEEHERLDINVAQLLGDRLEHVTIRALDIQAEICE